MRILVPVGVLLLAASAILTPLVREARKPGPDPQSFVQADPRARIAEGVQEHAPGLEYSGYAELLSNDPDDLEALRGRIRAGIRIAAASPLGPDSPQLLNAQVTDYLARRDAIDPNGDLIQECLRQFVDLRLGQDSWFVQSSYGILLAARGDETAMTRIQDYIRGGLFERHVFNFGRNVHLNWTLMRPLIEHYLQREGKGGLDGRVQAGLTLLEYHRVHRLGGELLAKYTPTIRAAIVEVISGLGPIGASAERFQMGVNALQGLVLLGEPQDLALLRDLDPIRYGGFADLIKIAKVWAGQAPFADYEVGGMTWKFLTLPARAFYFRAGALTFVRLSRVDADALSEEERVVHAAALDEARLIIDAGTIDSTAGTRVYCNYLLAVAEPEEAPAHLRQVIQGSGSTAIFAGCIADLEDPVPVLLPGLLSGEPEVVALAAVALLDLDGPPPLQPYATATANR